MDTREKLIETTRELLWERGYVATSPREIQRRSGVGQGSMYHHFTGKADLALESIRKNGDDMKRISAERLADGTTALEKLKSFLLRLRNIQRGCRIGGLTRDPDVIADAQMRAVLRDSFEWLHGALVDVIRDGQTSGEFDDRFNPDEIAAAVSAVVQGAYVLAKASGTDQPFHRAIGGMISLLEVSARREK